MWKFPDVEPVGEPANCSIELVTHGGEIYAIVRPVEEVG